MNPETVEQMLYERAVRTKIRAPRSERMSRFETGSLIAQAALICTLSLTHGGFAASVGNRDAAELSRPRTASISDGTLSMNRHATDPALASIAMSQLR